MQFVIATYWLFLSTDLKWQHGLKKGDYHETEQRVKIYGLVSDLLRLQFMSLIYSLELIINGVALKGNCCCHLVMFAAYPDLHKRGIM